MKLPRSILALSCWWIVVSAIVLASIRYQLVGAFASEDTFAQGLWNRALGSGFYQALIIAWFGCAFYTAACALTFWGWSRNQKGRALVPIFAWQIGISPAPPPQQFRADHLIWVARTALAPVREATVLFPALGFIGTVVGVSMAISGLNAVLDTGETSELLDGLRIAFDTTLIGLVASASLTVLVYLAETRLLPLYHPEGEG